MKKWLAVLVVLVLTLTLIPGCNGNPATTNGSTSPENTSTQGTSTGGEPTIPSLKLKVGMITGTGGLGDNNVNDAVHSGLKQACDELGITLDVVEPTETADIELYLTDFAQDGSYDLIVANSSGAKAPVVTVSALYPNENFLLVDNGIDGVANVASLTFSKPHEGFLSGIVCAYVATYDEITVNGKKIALDNSAKTLGCILGVENPDGLEAVSGFKAGYKFIEPGLKDLYTAIGSWNDQAAAREIALAQYNQGAQMIWQDSGSSSLGVFTAAKDADLFTMGWNNVQHTTDPEHILFSVVKDIPSATYQWAVEWANSGTFKSGQLDYGCKQDTVYIVWNEYWDAPAEVRDAVDYAYAQLKSGELEVPSTLDEVADFSIRYGD